MHGKQHGIDTTRVHDLTTKRPKSRIKSWVSKLHFELSTVKTKKSASPLRVRACRIIISSPQRYVQAHKTGRASSHSCCGQE